MSFWFGCVLLDSGMVYVLFRTALPIMDFLFIGPKVLLSVDAVRLSPSTINSSWRRNQCRFLDVGSSL